MNDKSSAYCVYLFIIGIVGLSICLCQIDNTENNTSKTTVISNMEDSSSTLSPASVLSSQSKENVVNYPDKYEFNFADIKNLEFWFGSGVGGSSTILNIKPDGKFNGYFSDSDMGDRDKKYPNGTRYECHLYVLI